MLRWHPVWNTEMDRWKCLILTNECTCVLMNSQMKCHIVTTMGHGTQLFTCFVLISSPCFNQAPITAPLTRHKLPFYLIARWSACIDHVPVYCRFCAGLLHRFPYCLWSESVQLVDVSLSAFLREGSCHIHEICASSESPGLFFSHLQARDYLWSNVQPRAVGIWISRLISFSCLIVECEPLLNKSHSHSKWYINTEVPWLILVNR